MLVHHAHNLLSQANIPSLMKHEFASGGLGELGAFDIWPELWLFDSQYLAEAQHIIDTNLLAKNTNENQIKLAKWSCKECDAINEATFEICWQCCLEKPR